MAKKKVETMDIFEEASRSKLRVSFKGSCTAEDLWDLQPEELDYIFKGLNAHKKEIDTESLLETRAKADPLEHAIDLSIAIIKHIVSVKLADREDALKVKVMSEKRQKLLGIKAKKQDDELLELSIEDIDELLEGL